MTEKRFWDNAYKSGKPEDTPWEMGKPNSYLVRLVEEGKIPGKRVLDTCSGLGTHAILLARNGYQVSGVEISPTAVARARDRSRKAGVNVNFINGAVQKFPFDDNYFDFIFDRGCLHHQYGNELQAYLAEAKRVLKVNGRMYVIAFTSRFSTKELKGLFEDNFVVLDHFKFQEKAADKYIR